ncbi:MULTISPECIES: LysR family transcriptional regulator [Flavobacterium]|jgi:LysR family cyn operon transcriptional activator|uniref:LysR family transcriptional regulator, cyn operon transcriptional activator n=1 Tax=Flavobacterium saccharophilum TaxID=29534 RepID=A0A1M7D0Z2_9FLAO|nr:MULTISPECIES: LysR family transcriptional regulator [Flavobacterium]WKL48942.1 LysR family transcriptional regulator [Flavobacterium pectinovorum]SHL73156.1 LysR family transcriptional regulator, cyn operon transcriptional activator [Flavobacterium saccharophilum]
MELRQLRYFLKAKELLNFTEAANQLNISQSTLSQQIKQLEEEINVPLFNRIGKRITLTEAGLLFSEFAFQSVSRANDGLIMMKDLNNLNVGSLSIGVTYALRNLLTRALILFSEKFPDIKVKIVFGTSTELIDRLNSTELDFVLTFREQADDVHLRYRSLFSSPMTLVVSKNSNIAGRSSISLKEIMDLPLAFPDSGYSTIQFINNLLKLKKLKPNVLVEINDISTLLELVKTGVWNTILTQVSVDDIGLSTIPIQGKNMLREATVISLKDAYQKKAAEAFQNYL